MKLWIQRLFDTFIVPIKDFRVIGWMFIAGLLAHQIDKQGLYNAAIILYVFMFCLFALFIRKLMFPYRQDTHAKQILKLSDFFKKAYAGNVAAAIVVCSQTFFMLGIIYVCVYWIRG